MKKVSYYFIFIVIAGGAIVSFWTYQKYFKVEEPKLLLFKVERGNLSDVVKVRGEAVAQKDFDLEFPFSGIVEKVFVQEGQQVSRGYPLVKLETIDFEIELRGLEASLTQKKANLDKLIAGATKEDIQIAETKVSNAQVALANAKKNLVDKLQDAYTKAEDAVRNRTDQLFSNPRSSDPQLNLSGVAAKTESYLESEKPLQEILLTSWNSSLTALSVDSDLKTYLTAAEANLAKVKLFLENVALAVNALTPSSTLTQTTIDNYRSDVSTGRTNVNTATVNLSAAEEKLRDAESDLALKQRELDFKKSGARSEDVTIAEAQIQEIESQISAVKEKIRKSTLYAPIDARVVKIRFEKQELFRTGETAISLSTEAHKLQGDVSELDIGEIRSGGEVLIKLDAFPDRELKGSVAHIETKEVIKDGDKYYRVNVSVEPHNLDVRFGMTADLTILISFKEDVLKIPELAVKQRDDKKFVVVLEENRQKETEVETGISDGESIEILSGLQEGQTVIVSTD